MTPRPCRSTAYQYVILETSCPHEWLGNFTTEQGLNDPYAVYDERLLELRDLLLVKVKELMAKELTVKQHKVLTCYLAGMTQQETANEMGCNQSSITKSLHGNPPTAYGVHNSKLPMYGGSLPKLKRLAAKDLGIQLILAAIADLTSA